MSKYLKYKYWEMPLIALFVAVLWIVTFIIIKNTVVFVDGYADTDTYMRALRIKNLILNPSWWEVKFMQSNYPFGEVLHWTRPMDLVWVPLAYLGTMFWDIKTAVLYSGYVISPLFNVLSALALVWALKPYFGAGLRFLAVVLLLVQIPLINSFAFPRPDHHSLLVFLSIWAIGCYLRGFMSKSTLLPFVGGVVLGVMSWVAAEGFLFAYIILAVLGFLWLKKYIVINEIVKASAGLFAMVTLAWLVNPPFEGWWHADNGRNGILQVAISGLTFLSFLGLARVKLESVKARVLAVAGAGLVSFGITVLIFGAGVIFANPIAPDIQVIWLSRVAEMNPTYINLVIFLLSSYVSFIALVALIFYMVMKFADIKEMPALWLVLIPLALYAVASVVKIRFTPYAITFAVFALLFVLNGWLCKAGMYGKIADYLKSSAKRRAAIAVGIVAAFLYSLLITLYMVKPMEPLVSSDTEKVILMSALASGKGAVLTDTFWGPEVMWKTGRPVIGTPYHRNVEGIKDNHEMLFADDILDLRELVIKHKVTEIFLPASLDFGKYYYLAAEENMDKMYTRLLLDIKIPCWLDTDEYFDGNHKSYHLYHVNMDNINCLFRRNGD